MAQQETITIQYIVHCGNHAGPQKKLESFQFTDQAPALICKPHHNKDDMPNPDATGMFLTSLVERHNEEILRSRAWRCATCNKPATEILHSALPFLSPNVERSLTEFEPTVVDLAAPICMSAGECDRAALETMHNIANNSLPHGIDTASICDKCGKRSGVKHCGGCKLLAYCSKECQIKSWSLHKKQCKQAQKITEKDISAFRELWRLMSEMGI